MPLLARGSFARAADGVQKAQKNPKKARAKNNKKRKSEEATPRILNILTFDSECSIYKRLSESPESFVYIAAALVVFKRFAAMSSSLFAKHFQIFKVYRFLCKCYSINIERLTAAVS